MSGNPYENPTLGFLLSQYHNRLKDNEVNLVGVYKNQIARLPVFLCDNNKQLRNCVTRTQHEIYRY